MFIDKNRIRSVCVALGLGLLATTGASAQYDSRQAEHASNVRAIQAQRYQHAANVAVLHGRYRAANAYARAAVVRRGQSHRDAGGARRLRHQGY